MKLKEQIEQLDGVISVKEKKGKLVVKYAIEQELIEEAKQRYPIGTTFIASNTSKKCVIRNTKFESGYEDGVLCINELESDGSMSETDGIFHCVYDRGKWAEIVEVELVEGDIYCSVEGGNSWIFRHKHTRLYTKERTDCDCYSVISFQSVFTQDDWICSRAMGARELYPATTEQKQKLIKAEVEHGFFWEIEKATV